LYVLDFFIGHLPDRPLLHASKKEMDEFHKRLGKPMKPKTPLHADKTSTSDGDLKVLSQAA